MAWHSYQHGICPVFTKLIPHLYFPHSVHSYFSPYKTPPCCSHIQHKYKRRDPTNKMATLHHPHHAPSPSPSPSSSTPSIFPLVHPQIPTHKPTPSSLSLPWGVPLMSETMMRSQKQQFRIGCRLSPEPRFSGSAYSAMSGAMGGNLEAAGAPTSVPVRLALELLQAGHRYLDVRTPEEFSAGHVPGAANVPYMLMFGSGMTKNDSFLEDVASTFGKDDEIIVGCQSGKRSLMAASVLLSAGYTNITDVAGGYAAWSENGLPTEPQQPTRH
ncbi:hypothetical protein Dimus_017429 [Dionaea muscipula]